MEAGGGDEPQVARKRIFWLAGCLIGLLHCYCSTQLKYGESSQV